MAEIIYVDEAEGKERVMNNVKIYLRLLGKFAEGTKIDALITSIEGQNWEEAKSEAHKLKGIAANLSLTELFRQSVELEKQLKAQSLKAETALSLKTCFAETIEEVKGVILRNA